ncbi:MAG: hypothetical protein K8W52_21880 [Deltaproteobacteria bacterium]|nr:hypothetical protein [Deltaproteobacteria bacterium]
MAARASILLLALAACGDPPAAPDAAIAVDAEVSGFPATLTLPASSATITQAFAATITGAAGAPVGAVALAANTGTVGLDGTTLAFVYEEQPFPPYTLYQGFAIGAARWDVFWAYCMNAALVDVYDEGVGAPRLFERAATGSCDLPMTTTTTTVALPAITIPAPTPLAGYTVEGPAIAVHHDGTGWLRIDGAQLPLIVFGDVDCSTVCGGAGWHELHTVFWDAAAQRVIVAIIYLEADRPGEVLITYGRALPDLSDPIGRRTLTATWTISAARQHHPPRAPFVGMPPPRALRP